MMDGDDGGGRWRGLDSEAYWKWAGVSRCGFGDLLVDGWAR